jgi:hypothetical protein
MGSIELCCYLEVASKSRSRHVIVHFVRRRSPINGLRLGSAKLLVMLKSKPPRDHLANAPDEHIHLWPLSYGSREPKDKNGRLEATSSVNQNDS